MIKGVFGVNIAVADLQVATAKYESLFNMRSRALTEGDFAFPGLVGSQFNINGFYLNLIASLNNDTSIAKFIERKGEGLFLLSVEIDDINKDEADIRSKGFDLLMKDSAKGDFGAVNFIHPKSLNGVQVEIFQPSQKARGNA